MDLSFDDLLLSYLKTIAFTIKKDGAAMHHLFLLHNKYLTYWEKRAYRKVVDCECLISYYIECHAVRSLLGIRFSFF